MSEGDVPLVIGVISEHDTETTKMEYAQGFKVPTGFVRCVKMNVALDVIEN